MLVVLGAVLLLWQRPWQESDRASVGIPADAASILADQFHLLSAARTEEQFVAAAGTTSTAETFARQAWAAREALGARRVELRYLGGGEVADRGDGSTEATVEVSWRPADGSGLSAAERRTSSVVFRIVPVPGDRFAVQGVRAGEGPLPVWLAGKVTIQRPPGAVVIRIDGGDDDVPVESMAASARSAVKRVVPGTAGTVTVVSPHSQDQMAQLAGQKVAAVRQIAAVTTMLDGRSGKSAGTVVLLNPAVFSTMDRRASQVVLTHEATHLLTGAVGSPTESWVVEGFADFVALHDDTAALSVSAGQVLGEVAGGKVPDRLPTATDFGSTRHELGAVYESAWMVFRLLGERFGDPEIVAFYRSVLDGSDLGTALRSAFGLSPRQLTRDWRSYLTKSASAVS